MPLHRILIQDTIRTDHFHALGQCLGDYQAIERITMVERHERHSFGVIERDRQVVKSVSNNRLFKEIFKRDR
jgi:hypothetical protein